MNNVATCLAQQKPPRGFYEPEPAPSRAQNATSTRSFGLLRNKVEAPPRPAQPTVAMPTRAELLDQAKMWVEQAQRLASGITEADGRTEECDVGCAAAKHNLGEFAEMAGNFDEARRRYTEARAFAESIKYADGVQQAAAGLKRLESKTAESRR